MHDSLLLKKIIQSQWAGGQASNRHIQDIAFSSSQLSLGQVGEWSTFYCLLLKNLCISSGQVGRPLTDMSKT